MAMAGPELRVALVGYGLAGAVFHAPLVRATPGLRLTSIVTADPSRQAQARRDFPAARILPDARILWEAPRGHDLVVIAAPNSAHAPLASAALRAGMAVVVDKPLAPTAAEARALAQLAADLGRVLTVFHNRRWDGDMLTLRQLLQRGGLGRPLRFESRFERWRPRPRPGAWRDQASAQAGGGVLLDLGSHIVDQALQLFGRPAAVYAEVRASRPGATVDDDVFIALSQAQGVQAHLWASAIASIPGPRMLLLGDGGGYVKLGLDIQEEALREGVDPAAPGWGLEPPERWGRVVDETGERPVETAAGAWPDFYSGVLSALREGAPPPVDPWSAVEVLEVIEAARKSAATGEVVRLVSS
jgi:predicted dehydrogenase